MGRPSAVRSRQNAELLAASHWRESRERGALAAVWRRISRRIWNRFCRLNAPVVYPWSPSREGTHAAHELHRLAAELLRESSHGFLSRVWLGAKAVLWPPMALGAATVMLLRYGAYVRASSGQTRREQWRDLVDAALNHGIFPTEYYHHRVFSGAARSTKTLYLNEREIIALLARASRGADTRRVDDLHWFLSECRSAGLPTPRTVATFRKRGVVDSSIGRPDDLPRKDIYLRPEVWREGAGAELWRWNVQAGAWMHREQSLAPAALFEHCRASSARRLCVVQECLRNHPEVARFSAGGLCSVRIATGMSRGGVGTPLFAVFNLPASDANGLPTPAGELHAGINLRDGALMPATGEFISDGEFEAHPGNGTVIAGVMLPHWSRVLDLAIRAHEHFAEIPFVGWEIGLAAGGPVLLEASTNWGVFPHVLPAETPFAELCLERIDSIQLGKDGKRGHGDGASSASAHSGESAEALPQA